MLIGELQRVLRRKEKRSERDCTQKRAVNTGTCKTPQELNAEILRLSRQGLKGRQIAQTLKITETKVSRTINHRQ